MQAITCNNKITSKNESTQSLEKSHNSQLQWSHISPQKEDPKKLFFVVV